MLARRGSIVAEVQAKNGTKITIENTTEQITRQITAALFTPPSNFVVSAFSIEPGSALTFAGNTFALSGGFNVVSTNVDYNPNSATFGVESGIAHLISIQASGAGGAIHFTVPKAPTFTINLAPLWARNLPNGGLSVPFTLSFSGTLSFNSLSSPFTGVFSGRDTFFPNGSVQTQGLFNISSDFGSGTGTLFASAHPQITPEPSTLGLLGIGVACMAGCTLRSRRKAYAILAVRR